MRNSTIGLVLMITACSKAQPFTADAPPIASAVMTPSSSAALDRAPARTSCRVTDAITTLDDHTNNQEALENLRVLAEGDTTIVTYERQSHYDVGDSWHAPVVAMRKGNGAFESTALSVDAYACATNGRIAPNSLTDPVLAWGVANKHGYQIWSSFPKAAKSPPARTIDTPRKEVSAFAASHGVAISITIDLAYEAFCVRGGTNAKHGVWIHGFDNGSPVAESVFTSLYSAKAPDAPSIAMGERRGVFSYRDDGVLWVGFLGAPGKPSGKPLRLDTGAVGAPALAMMGEDAAVAVWARRASNDAPYRLVYARLEEGKSIAPLPIPMTTETGFAPSVLADAKDMIVSWMDGDDAKKGAIHLARHSFAESTWPSVRVSPRSESNARDPELSGTVARPVVAYALFDKPREGGVVRIAESICE